MMPLHDTEQPTGGALRVLLVGDGPNAAETLDADPAIGLDRAENCAAACGWLATVGYDAILLGDGLQATDRRALAQAAGVDALTPVLTASAVANTPGNPTLQTLAALPSPGKQPSSDAHSLQREAVDLLTRAGMQERRGDVAALLEESVKRLVPCHRVGCWLFDDHRKTLRTPHALEAYGEFAHLAQQRDKPLAASCSAVQGRASPNGGAPPRPVFQLALPLPGTADLTPLLLLQREARPFTLAELVAVEQLGEYLAPHWLRLQLGEQVEREAARAMQQMDGNGLYRERALAHHQRAALGNGDLVRLSPAWSAWTYRLLLAFFVVGLVLAFTVQVREYARGSALVRIPDNVDIRAPVQGMVEAVLVHAGERVAAGAVLLRLDTTEQRAALQRVEQEFHSRLVARLRNPGDASTAAPLAALRADLALARKRLEQRTLRAERAGAVLDLRTETGRLATAGSVLLSMKTGTAPPVALALVAGQYRPRLHPGMVLRLHLDGYPYAVAKLTIESVGDAVLGPAEARRYLGGDGFDSVAINGPVVPVTARISSSEFTADGQRYRYHDGMSGRVEIAVQTHSLAATLVPGLTRFMEAGDE